MLAFCSFWTFSPHCLAVTDQHIYVKPQKIKRVSHPSIHAHVEGHHMKLYRAGAVLQRNTAACAKPYRPSTQIRCSRCSMCPLLNTDRKGGTINTTLLLRFIFIHQPFLEIVPTAIKRVQYHARRCQDTSQSVDSSINHGCT